MKEQLHSNSASNTEGGEVVGVRLWAGKTGSNSAITVRVGTV